MKAARSSSDRDSEAPPPAYEDAVGSDYAKNSLDDTKSSLDYARSASDYASFTATSELDVQAIGYDMNQAIMGRTLENIPVCRVGSGEAEYTSVRLKRDSNSCALVRASDPSQSALISTIYRFGPLRAPRIRVLPDGAGVSVEEAIKDEDVRGELVQVKSRSMVSRAQVFDTSLGKFEWRYGTGEEKAACGADSLLVMERVDRVTLPDGSKTKSGARVAQLVRNDQLRTPGSVRYSGGNGGRLTMDLRMWDGEKSAGARGVEACVVASCILMLKREADRFIDNHIAAVV